MSTPFYDHGKPTDLQVIGKAFERIGQRVFLIAGENEIYLTVNELKIRFDLKGKFIR